jgi:hypothetical protein
MESKKESKKISSTSTKQEMLQAYNALLKNEKGDGSIYS